MNPLDFLDMRYIDRFFKRGSGYDNYGLIRLREV